MRIRLQLCYETLLLHPDKVKIRSIWEERDFGRNLLKYCKVVANIFGFKCVYGKKSWWMEYEMFVGIDWGDKQAC